MSDGRLWFNTKIDNTGVEKDLRDLERKIAKSQEAISKAENIEVTDKDIEEKLREIAARYGSTGDNVEEMIKNPTDQMRDYVAK